MATQHSVMNRLGGDCDPVIVPVDDRKLTMTFEEWLAVIDEDEPVDLGVSAAELLTDAREVGEV